MSQVRVGQRYRDTDPRRGGRVGVVLEVRRFAVTLEWPSGRCTSVRRSALGASGSRGYVLVERRRRPPPVSMPAGVSACLVGRDASGGRRWACHVCGALGALRPPWRVVLWWAGLRDPRPRALSTVVCSGRCARRLKEVGRGRPRK